MAHDTQEVPVSPDASELDLTNAHLQNLDDVPLPETLSVSNIVRSPLAIALCSAAKYHQPYCTCLQLLDLTANRLKELDSRVLKLPGDLRGSCL